MKKMKKILIVDDTKENLDAAQEAAKSFTNVRFEFFSSAAKALRRLKKVDAIITDLFFPRENDARLLSEYRNYICRTSQSGAFRDVVRKYYENDYLRANDALEENLNKMQENSNASEFTYGGALMLEAEYLGLAHLLITNIHAHDWGYKEELIGSVDGMIILLPLMEMGIITVEEAMNDGNGSKHYLGGEAMIRVMKKEAFKHLDELSKSRGCSFPAVLKEAPEVWEKAIALVIDDLINS